MSGEKIYIVIVDDLHSDVEALPYTNKEQAIKVAKTLAKKYCRHPAYYLEIDYAGCIFCVNYSSENDSVRVVAETLDQEI